MAIRTKTIYITTDGQEFENKKMALHHEKNEFVGRHLLDIVADFTEDENERKLILDFLFDKLSEVNAAFYEWDDRESDEDC